MYQYPYGDTQQLNLDWILTKIKELEAGEADLEEISNALISLTYNPNTLYARYDYAFRNGKLYRCLSGTSGAFDPTAWQEALIGDDLAIRTRWINALNAAAVVDVKFDTSGTNGKIQQKYNDQYHDVVEVDYTPVQNSKRPLSSNAGYELNGAITTVKEMISVWIEPTSTASRAYSVGEYLIRGNFFYRVTVPIAVGDTLSGSNLRSARIGEELTSVKQAAEFQIQGNNVRAVMKNGIVDLTAIGGFWQDDGTSDHLLQWSSTSTGTFTTVQLPTEIRPYLYTEIAVANIARRVTIKPDGYMATDSTLTVTALRFSGTWIAANAI